MCRLLGYMLFGVHKSAHQFVWFLYLWFYDAGCSTDYAETNAFFLGNSTDVTSQMSVQTDWPCATSTQELQPSETLSVVARKQSKYWNYV